MLHFIFAWCTPRKLFHPSIPPKLPNLMLSLQQNSLCECGTGNSMRMGQGLDLLRLNPAPQAGQFYRFLLKQWAHHYYQPQTQEVSMFFPLYPLLRSPPLHAK